MRPVTKGQWQDAVDAAELLAHLTTAQVLLFIEMGRIFNLVDDNGEIDIQACYEVINDARNQGVMPSADAIQRFISDRPSLWERILISVQRSLFMVV